MCSCPISVAYYYDQRHQVQHQHRHVMVARHDQMHELVDDIYHATRTTSINTTFLLFSPQIGLFFLSFRRSMNLFNAYNELQFYIPFCNTHTFCSIHDVHNINLVLELIVFGGFSRLFFVWYTIKWYFAGWSRERVVWRQRKGKKERNKRIKLKIITHINK